MRRHSHRITVDLQETEEPCNKNPATAPAWDVRLQKIVIVIGRLGLAYLFFSQLFWKLPPTFGCGNNYAYPKPAAENYWEANGSSGLCFWLGMETVFANQPRQVLVTDMKPAGLAQDRHPYHAAGASQCSIPDQRDPAEYRCVRLGYLAG